MNKAIVSDVNGISGRFACVYGGIRTEDFSHGDESKAFGGAVSISPAELSTWLVLADRLAEEGNPAEHMIRVIFQEGYEPPAGFRGEITRGGNYFQSGSNYTESVTFSWGEDRDHFESRGFTHHYWSNGSFCSSTSRAEVVAALTKTGGRNVAKWLNLRVSGRVPPAYRIVPEGTTVIVVKKGETKARTHTTTTTVRIPADAKKTYTSWGGIETASFEFDHMGYTVSVLIRDIQSVAKV